LSVYARIERRNDLKTIAKDLYMETADTNEYISEEQVMPDQCTSHASTIWFVCAKNKFNCITSTAGKFACTSNRYNDLICQPLAPTTTFECVTTGYAVCPPNNQIL
jgi:hypothetical protein